MNGISLPPGVPAYKPVQESTPKSPSAIGGSAEEIQDNFMKMLMAQIKNQNPLDPAKPAEFTTQLTQLNTVKGIGDLNKNVSSFLDQIRTTDFMNFSQVVGRNALVPGNQFIYSGEPVILGGELSEDVTDLKAVVKNSSGVVVDELVLGQVKAGPIRFQWDGNKADGSPAESGVYRLNFEGRGAQVGSNTAYPYVTAEVASVGREGDSVRMRLADGRLVESKDILEWLK